MQNQQREKYRQLGLNIAYYRKLRGLSQLQLAEMVDISRTHISRHCNCKRWKHQIKAAIHQMTKRI